MAAYLHSYEFSISNGPPRCWSASCTGAQRHKLPTGSPSQQTIGAQILPRCSRHGRPLVIPIVRPTRSRLDRMFENILRGPIVEFPTQYSALRYASDGMLDHQCEDLRIYSYEWYRSPFHQSEHLFAHRLIFFYLHFSTPITNRRRRVMYSGPVTGADATAVLIEIPVQHVMHRLDAPVPVVVFEKLLDICLYGTQARDSVRIFPPAFTALVFVFDNPFHHERLPDMWKFKILAKLRFHPDPAALDAPVLKVGCS